MTIHAIGAGPGAADLITLRGRDLLAPGRELTIPARESALYSSDYQRRFRGRDVQIRLSTSPHPES